MGRIARWKEGTPKRWPCTGRYCLPSSLVGLSVPYCELFAGRSGYEESRVVYQTCSDFIKQSSTFWLQEVDWHLPSITLNKFASVSGFVNANFY